MGKAETAEFLLKKGANPNIRSTSEKGLRMHPLSWNVYAGHVPASKVLLEHGADVNLPYDDLGNDGTQVTVWDTLSKFLETAPEGSPQAERYFKMKELLTQYGAKSFADLEPEL